MKEFVVYTAARFGLFIVAWAAVAGVWLLATGGDPIPVLWPLLLAAVISTVASIYLLAGLRASFTEKVNERAHRMSSRFEEMRAKEDSD